MKPQELKPINLHKKSHKKLKVTGIVIGVLFMTGVFFGVFMLMSSFFDTWKLSFRVPVQTPIVFEKRVVVQPIKKVTYQCWTDSQTQKKDCALTKEEMTQSIVWGK